MRNKFSKTALAVALALCATAGFAQAPGGAPPGGMGGMAPGAMGPGGPRPGGPGMGMAPGAGAGNVVVVANPTYTSLLMEVAVNRPAAEVWKRVGKYCDIGEWMQIPCTITSGKDGEIGAVRSIGREVLVGKTELSYTYTQPVAANQPYILYHGTLEAKPVTATSSKLYYTLMWDNSTCADDAARQRDKTQRRTTFQTALNNMKVLAEGGTLPPGRAGGPGGCVAPRAPGGPGGPGAPGAAGGAPRQ